MDKKSFIALLIMVGLFVAVIILRNNDQNDLKKKGVIVQAKILRVNFGGKVSGGFNCVINYKNKEKELPSVSSLQRGKFYFIGKTFPAMYSPNTDILEVLITPSDFEKFNLPFPDSLSWVANYVSN